MMMMIFIPVCHTIDGFIGESYALEAAKRMNLPGNNLDVVVVVVVVL